MSPLLQEYPNNCTLLRNGVLVNSYNVTPSHNVPSIKIRERKATFGSQFIGSAYVELAELSNVEAL